MPFKPENRRFTVGIIVVVASIVVIAIGVQAYLAQQDNAARDKAAAEDRERQRAYVKCLNKFASDLVDTLKVRAGANQALIEAGERKDKALDELINVSAAAQASGAQSQDELPPGLLDRYEAALTERVAAQKEYNRLKAEAKQTRAENPLVKPKATCTR